MDLAPEVPFSLVSSIPPLGHLAGHLSILLCFLLQLKHILSTFWVSKTRPCRTRLASFYLDIVLSPEDHFSNPEPFPPGELLRQPQPGEALRPEHTRRLLGNGGEVYEGNKGTLAQQPTKVKLT